MRRLRVTFPFEGEDRVAQTVDVSKTGALFSSAIVPEVGTQLLLSLSDNTDPNLSLYLKATVVRIREESKRKLFAVEFGDAVARDPKRLGSFLENVLSISAGLIRVVNQAADPSAEREFAFSFKPVQQEGEERLKALQLSLFQSLEDMEEADHIVAAFPRTAEEISGKTGKNEAGKERAPKDESGEDSVAKGDSSKERTTDEGPHQPTGATTGAHTAGAPAAREGEHAPGSTGEHAAALGDAVLTGGSQATQTSGAAATQTGGAHPTQTGGAYPTQTGGARPTQAGGTRDPGRRETAGTRKAAAAAEVFLAVSKVTPGVTYATGSTPQHAIAPEGAVAPTRATGPTPKRAATPEAVAAAGSSTGQTPQHSISPTAVDTAAPPSPARTPRGTPVARPAVAPPSPARTPRGTPVARPADEPTSPASPAVHPHQIAEPTAAPAPPTEKAGASRAPEPKKKGLFGLFSGLFGGKGDKGETLITPEPVPTIVARDTALNIIYKLGTTRFQAKATRLYCAGIKVETADKLPELYGNVTVFIPLPGGKKGTLVELHGDATRVRPNPGEGAAGGVFEMRLSMRTDKMHLEMYRALLDKLTGAA